MEKELLVNNAEMDIKQKIKSINALIAQREEISGKCSKEFLNFKNPSSDSDMKILDQALVDAILHSMATLIDYYCIYCMIKLDIDFKKITKVQYRLIGKKYLIENSTLERKDKESFSLAVFKQKFEERLTSCCGMDIKEININEYWTGYVADAISTTLYAYGILENRRVELNFDKVKKHFIFDDKIATYHHCMNFLYCNPSYNGGVRFNIYLEINNCLKHNTIPRIMRNVEHFEKHDEHRLYIFFEIDNYKSIFLKDGFLRDILEMDFDTLKKELENKSIKDNFELCQLEKNWEIRQLINIDKDNGYISKDGKTLFFFVDGVLFEKTKNSILVDSMKSFHDVLSRLTDEIKTKLEYLKL